MSPYCTVSDTAKYRSKIVDCNLFHFYLATPLGVTALEFRPDIWHQKSRVSTLSYGVVCVILRLAAYAQIGSSYNFQVSQGNVETYLI